jgi:hypothetical protein
VMRRGAAQSDQWACTRVPGRALAGTPRQIITAPDGTATQDQRGRDQLIGKATRGADGTARGPASAGVAAPRTGRRRNTAS